MGGKGKKKEGKAGKGGGRKRLSPEEEAKKRMQEINDIADEESKVYYHLSLHLCNSSEKSQNGYQKLQEGNPI
jgi:hypothetical protein